MPHSQNSIPKTYFVPKWKNSTVTSLKSLIEATPEQKEFYSIFKSNYLRGVFLDLHGNTNYALILFFELLNDYKILGDLKMIRSKLEALVLKYPQTKQDAIITLKTAIASISGDCDGQTECIITKDSPLYRSKHEQIDNAKKQNCTWVSPGKEVIVHDYKLLRGNFYIGNSFFVDKQFGNDYEFQKSPYIYASVIDRELIISDVRAKSALFSSYSDMIPRKRDLYLKWLSGNISTEDIPDDILMLHFTGLQLRMFFDLRATTANRIDILNEVIAYKKEFSAVGRINYINVFDYFIDSALTKYFKKEILTFLDPCDIKKMDLRIYRSYVLNSLITPKKVVSKKNAYNFAKKWIYTSFELPEIYDSYAFTIFSDQVDQLLNGRIEAIECSDPYIYVLNYYIDNSSSYTPERASLECNIFESSISVTSLEYTISKCYTPVYEAFKSYIATVRGNVGAVTMDAVLSLPRHIDLSKNEKVASLITFLENKLESNKFPTVEVNDLLHLWSYNYEDQNIPKKNITSILEGLDRLNYGIEPDYRINGISIKPKEQCIIYAKKRHPILLSDSLLHLYQVLKLAVVLSQADGEINSAEKEYCVKNIIDHISHPSQKNHLQAHIEFLSLSKQNIAKAKKGTLPFSTDDLEMVYNFLIGLSFADGPINDLEINAIVKIMTFYEFDCADIHSKIHRIYTGEVVTVHQQSASNQSSLSAKQKTTKSEFKIDLKKLSQIEGDTKEANKILSKIFTTSDAEPSSKPSNINDKLLFILRQLLDKECWQRADVEVICKSQNMMLGYALELINDYSYSRIDDAVVEDQGQTIYVNQQYKEQLLCLNQ